MRTIVIIGGLVCSGVPAAADDGYDGAGVYDQVCALTQERFLDPELGGVDWDVACAARRERARAAGSPAELAPVVNDLLGELGMSHTAFYARGTRRWGELIDVFFDDAFWPGWPEGFAELPATYTGIGVVTREIDGAVFVADVYPGTPAAEAGVVAGDELISVNGARWTDHEPWPTEPGVPAEILARRDPGGAERAVAISAAPIRPDEVFLRAQEESLRVVERDGVRVASVRLRNGGGAYTELFERQMRDDRMRGADALVIDIRGGWGGVPLDFVSRFDRDVAVFTARMRGEDWADSPVVWRKPLVVLIDGGSRSGKEIFAYNVRTAGVGTLVGERTLGAVVGGSPLPLDDGSVLYLAVMDVLVDGERLEGVGVAPDIEVRFDLAYAAGADPQFEAAIAEAARQAREPRG